MTRTHLHWLPLTAAALLIAPNLPAQNEPVRNWAAPLYWQPSEKESAIMPRAGDRQPEAAASALAATSTPPLVFVAVTPCRIMDTRGYDPTFGNGTEWGPPTLTAGGTRTVRVAGLAAGYCSLPATAQAVSLNVTLWPAPGVQVQWLTLWPAGQPKPTASTINDYQGTVFSPAHGVTMYGLNNAAIVPLGNSGGYGAFSIYVTDATHLFIDVNGYYLAPSALALGSGTAAATALSFGGDAGTGIFSAGSGTVNIATGGISRLAVRPDGDLELPGSIRKAGVLFIHNLGNDNTAVGRTALGAAGETGGLNSAFGNYALSDNTSGASNTAVGRYALTSNETGGENTAVGKDAMFGNTSGAGNVGVGSQVLNNSNAALNTAVGTRALYNNTAGQLNAALGAGALYFATGSNNVAVGYEAGKWLGSGNYNIMIGNGGTNADTAMIRIGDSNQTATYIAGIRDAGGSGNTVYVDANGKLFSLPSARRFKQDIQDLGDTTEVMMGLRPVRFRYRTQGPEGAEQFGLIAEEVEEVAPELVGHDKDGRIDSVAYDKVNTMLLNEVQKQHRLIRRLESRLAELESRER